MLSKVITVASLLSTTYAQTAGNVGASFSLAENVIMQAKDVYGQMILDTMAYVPLPNYDDPNSKDYAHDNYFTISQDASAVAMNWMPQNNGIYLLFQGLSGVVYTGHYYYHIAPLMNAEGHAEVLMKTINLGIGITFKTQVLPDGRTVPAVDSYNILVDINRDDIDIKIWGNFWSDMAAACEIFFKSTVVHAIQDTVDYILRYGIPEAINAEFAKSDAESNIYMHPTWMVDWMTPASAIVAPDSFQVGIEADFWDSVYGEQYPADTIPVMPYKLSSSAAGF